MSKSYSSSNETLQSVMTVKSQVEHEGFSAARVLLC